MKDGIKTLIWSEAHRPTKLKQLVLLSKNKRLFESYLEKKQIPNILLHGPPGSGKTTLAMIIMRKIAARKLILNASSEDRGISTIKLKVKQFAGAQRESEEKLNIVLLDEADGLTGEAQDALKNTIDKYHKNCRFILTCNQIDKITAPVISRCILFEFHTLPIEKVVSFSEKILRKERVKYNIKEIKKIIELHYPDIRTIINALQLNSCGGTLEAPTTIDTKKIKKYLLSGRITSLRNLWKNMVDFTWLFKYLFNSFIPDNMKDSLKADASIITAEYLHRNRNIVDKEINITALCLELMSIMELEISFKK